MKRNLIVAPVLLLLAVSLLSACSSSSADSPRYAEITIGALADQSGDLAFAGQAAVAALEVAASDINDHLSSIHSGYRVKLNIQETGGNPEIALQKLKVLASQGIKFIIGPLSSGELAAAKDYADQNNLILVSPTSTALSLAEKDNIYRLILNDSYQAKAIVRLISDDKVTTLIPLYRGDIWGDGLVNQVKANFEKLGGTVMEGFRYPTDTKDFTPALAAIESQLKQTSGNAAVYLVSFTEAVPIFTGAAAFPSLSAVKWYGSDGTAGNNALTGNRTAAEFAINTGFISPAYGPGTTAIEAVASVTGRVKQSLGWDPPLSTLLCYDILWVAVESYLACGSNNVEFDDLKKSFLQTVSTYYGVSGSTALDEFGDRIKGSYFFWTIEKSQDAFRWISKKILIMYPTYEDWYYIP